MSDESVPMDVTAMQAEDIIRAAIDWRYKQGHDPVLNTVEWRLYEACSSYGDSYKGVKAK